MPGEARGLREKQSQIRDVADRLKNLKPVLDVIAADLRTLVDDSFDQQRSPAGMQWQPLAPSTIRRKRGGAGRILIDTGRLRQSITATASNSQIEFGTNVAYAGAHQFGVASRNLPARPFLPIEGAPGSYRLTSSGPAASIREHAIEAIRTYVQTGRVG